MANAVILGAGRLGKGFLGETLANAPRWHTTFLDKDAGVIQKLNETGSYHVQVYRKECIEEHEVSGYEAVSYTHLFDEKYRVLYEEKITHTTIRNKLVYAWRARTSQARFTMMEALTTFIDKAQ